VILSTHDPDQAFALNTDVLLMKEGLVVAQGGSETALTGATLGNAYGVSVTVEQTPTGRTVCLPSLAAHGESQRTVPIPETS
jgi:iron complex transport system ATP-binding protein